MAGAQQGIVQQDLECVAFLSSMVTMVGQSTTTAHTFKIQAFLHLKLLLVLSTTTCKNVQLV